MIDLDTFDIAINGEQCRGDLYCYADEAKKVIAELQAEVESLENTVALLGREVDARDDKIERLIDDWAKATAHNSQLLAENKRLREALQQVVDWKMPECNVAFGSSGERGYIRGIAKEALEGGDE